MNKKQLLEALSNYPDDTEIVVWTWTKAGSKYYYANPTLTNNPETKPARYELSLAFDFVPESEAA